MVPIRGLIAILSYAIALCGIVPLFPWLGTAPRLALAAGMAAGIWQDRRGAWPVKNWLLNASIVPVFLYYGAQYSRANPLQPVVSVLAVMLAVRLGGEKSGRHHLQIQALALFCLAASSLFDLSPSFLAYLTLMLLLVALSLVLLTFHAQDSRMALAGADLRKVLAAGLIMPLASLPLLVIFFPILPRTQIPLWNFLSAPAAGVTGFSDKVEPGSSAAIAEVRTLVFRAELPRLPQPAIYWRGTVFNQMMGNRWIRNNAVPLERALYRGPRIVQTIYPEPALSRVLIALDAPANIGLPRVYRSPDGVYELPRATSRRLVYPTESVTAGTLPLEKEPDRAFYLRLPDDTGARIRHLADSLRRNGESDARRVELLETFFRNGNYRYALQGLPTGANALEQFLFEKRQGNCEFFASAFAVVLRAAGVPARLVGGYLGGEYNELGGYYLVSADMAHVWVEALVTGKGWVRIDPSGYAQNAGAFLGRALKRDLLGKLRLAIDSFDHTWNRTVITYDFERQAETARSAGRRLQGIGVRTMLQGAMSVVLVMAGMIGAIQLLTHRKELFPSREERLLRSFFRRIEQDCGVKAEQGRQGLFELAAACGHGKVTAFVGLYAGAVYRDRKLTTGEYGELKRMLREGFKEP